MDWPISWNDVKNISPVSIELTSEQYVSLVTNNACEFAVESLQPYVDAFKHAVSISIKTIVNPGTGPVVSTMIPISYQYYSNRNDREEIELMLMLPTGDGTVKILVVTVVEKI